jgi:hypothetical protein
MQRQQYAPNVQQQMEELWQRDPKTAMKVEMDAQVRLRDYLDNKIEDDIDKASQKHKDFGNYERQIRRYVRTLPLESRGTPNLIEGAYFWIKGQNADQLTQQSQQDLLNKIKAGEQVQGINAGAVGSPTGNQGPQVTDDEKAAAAAMGISIEDYIKNRPVARAR